MAKSLKSHHSKPYRKRHLGLFLVSFVSILALTLLIVSNDLSNRQLIKDARNAISTSLGISSELSDSSRISSSYGFSIQYDSQLLYASGLDASSNILYMGQDLTTPRSYGSIRISPDETGQEGTSSSLSIEYHYSEPTGASADLAKLEAKYVRAQNNNFTRLDSNSVIIGGQDFLVSEWETQPTEFIGSKIINKLTSYVGVVNGAPLSMVINYGIGDKENVTEALNSSVRSLELSAPSQSVSIKSTDKEETGSIALLDNLLQTAEADAASLVNPGSSELISALYGPSVVKIYNAYCMDIAVLGQPFVQDACSASTGSGFFIGDGGNIATNGHVAVNSPLDIVISYAFEKVSKGDASYLNTLADAASLTNADIAGAASQQEQIRIIVEKLYTIPGSVISSKNRVDNILVGLGEKQPDMKRLLDQTKARQSYPEEDSIRRAELVAYNYRAIDGADTGSFKASDVAIIKIGGLGYPSTKLGSIAGLAQGSGLSIIGYPGAAGSNPLVESTQSRATLTSGKVSSIKSATGSKAQLIETDATIGHGNSGGPAFNDSGEVVGIATYTIDGSGDGNGVFNYIRDIADLQDLASKNSIDTSMLSQTQTKWQMGIEKFYQARYSAALNNFAEVKLLYPQHPRVDQLIELSKQRIAYGQEAKEITSRPIIVSLVLLAVVLIASVALMTHHHKRHLDYKAQVQNKLSPGSSTTQQSSAQGQSVSQNNVSEPPHSI